MGKSSDYYNSNPAAKAVKDAYQKKYNAKPENIKSRGEDNKARKDLNCNSNMDASRKSRIGKNGKLITYWSCEESSKNRGKTGDKKNAMPGDKRSRPGKNQ